MQLSARRSLEAFRVDASTCVEHKASTVTVVPCELDASRMLHNAASRLEMTAPDLVHVGSLQSHAATQCTLASDVLARGSGPGQAACLAEHLADRVSQYDEILQQRQAARSASLDDTHLRFCRAHAQRWRLVAERAAMPPAARTGTTLLPRGADAPWLRHLAQACQTSPPADGEASQPWRMADGERDGDLRLRASEATDPA